VLLRYSSRVCCCGIVADVSRVTLVFIFNGLAVKCSPVENTRRGIVMREKTNKMQQSGVYYQLLSQHVSGIIMPIFRRTKTVCNCIWYAALVLPDVVGSGCGALRCRVRAL